MTDILETIDNALDDYAVSNDAMRWTPEPVGESPHTTTGRFVVDRAGWYEIHGYFGGPELVRQIWTALDVVIPQQWIEAATEPTPQQRALEARRNRHTGPPAPRMDGRRR